MIFCRAGKWILVETYIDLALVALLIFGWCNAIFAVYFTPFFQIPNGWCFVIVFALLCTVAFTLVLNCMRCDCKIQCYKIYTPNTFCSKSLGCSSLSFFLLCVCVFFCIQSVFFFNWLIHSNMWWIICWSEKRCTKALKIHRWKMLKLGNWLRCKKTIVTKSIYARYTESHFTVDITQTKRNIK